MSENNVNPLEAGVETKEEQFAITTSSELCEDQNDAVDYQYDEDVERDNEDENEKPLESNHVNKLLALVGSKESVFFHDEIQTPYVAITVKERREIWGIKSSKFKMLLKKIFYDAERQPIAGGALSQVLDVLEGRAVFDGEMKPLSVRVAKHKGCFYYDLTNKHWSAVKIGLNGWEVVKKPPILFTRFNHQNPQDMPDKNGNPLQILKHINIKKHKTLFICWMISNFIPDIPHPAGNFNGEKGAAKTTVNEMLRFLIDPSALETLAFPSDPKSLIINLQKNWFLPYDNVSSISPETSDALCRAITGGGMQQRKLYSDDDDVIFKYMRCISLNGINCVATRPDLLDRSILFELSRIPEEERKEYSVVWKEFEADIPYILGGIFNVLSKAVQIHPTVKLEKLSRMADFQRWGYAIAEAIEIGLGETFIKEYAENQEMQNTEAIKADPVATLIIEFMRNRSEWEDRVAKLFDELVKIAPEHGIEISKNSFPSQPNVLSRRLTGIKSNLESVGITFNKREVSRGTVIKIEKSESSPLSPHHHES
jgi:hypothetical protein